jgi:hypothetical protein
MGSLRQKALDLKQITKIPTPKNMEGKEGDPDPGDKILDHQPRGWQIEKMNISTNLR